MPAHHNTWLKEEISSLHKSSGSCTWSNSVAGVIWQPWQYSKILRKFTPLLLAKNLWAQPSQSDTCCSHGTLQSWQRDDLRSPASIPHAQRIMNWHKHHEPIDPQNWLLADPTPCSCSATWWSAPACQPLEMAALNTEDSCAARMQQEKWIRKQTVGRNAGKHLIHKHPSYPRWHEMSGLCGDKKQQTQSSNSQGKLFPCLATSHSQCECEPGLATGHSPVN